MGRLLRLLRLLLRLLLRNLLRVLRVRDLVSVSLRLGCFLLGAVVFAERLFVGELEGEHLLQQRVPLLAGGLGGLGGGNGLAELRDFAALCFLGVGHF